jgi:hypothetical protein
MRNKSVILLIFIVASLCTAFDGARYLIIAPDNYVATVQPLAIWKTKKGTKAVIIPTSVTGGSNTQIRNYIINAYNTWRIRPEYILLVGAGSVIPSWDIGNNDYSDDYYADMTGDYKIELSIGRFPCTTTDQCRTIVAKTLINDRTPYMDDTTWYKKGTAIIREDGTPHPDTVYWNDARYVMNFWRTAGFSKIDSISRLQGYHSSDITNAINNGRAYVIYRGEATVNWYQPFQINPNQLSNGYKTPIIISGTCGTMSLSYQNNYLGDEFLNAGSATSPKGAAGFFGSSVSTSGPGLSWQRGTVTKSFFTALYSNNLYKLGDAAKRAKFMLDSIRPPYYVETRYKEWNLFGDPELNLWSKIPQQISVTHDTIIFTRPQTFSVTVQKSGIPLGGALVCIQQDSFIYNASYTNGNGQASFSIYPQFTNPMSVTVTAQNCIPYEKNISIIYGNVDHDVGVVSIIEPQGTISSGTVIAPKVKVRNYGTYIDSFPVTFKIDTIYNHTISSITLAPNDSVTVVFPSWTAISGNYTTVAFTKLATDQWHQNDSAISSIIVNLANDVGVEEVIKPDSMCPLNTLTIPSIRVKNYGGATQINFSVTCSIVGANGTVSYINTQNVSSILPGDTVRVNFAGWTPSVTEMCTVKMRTSLVGDQNPANDSKTKLVRITMLFFAEGFNDVTFPPPGWQNVIVQGTFGWQRTASGANPYCTPYEGNAMITYPNWSATISSSARLISPPIIIGANPISCSLKFCMYHDPAYPGGQFGPDSVKIEYSSNGTDFNRIAAFRRYEPIEGWVEHSVYFGSLTGTIYVGILGLSEYGNNTYVDYLRMYAASGINEETSPNNSLNIKTILSSPKPNPASRGHTRLSFTLAEPSWTALRIYDASGRVIKTMTNMQLNKGSYNFSWNGRDDSNQNVAEGIYFCSLKTPKQSFAKKIVLTN